MTTDGAGREFAFESPAATMVAMYVGSAIAFVLALAFVNGWFGFSFADLFEGMEGWGPPSLPVLNGLLALVTAAWFLGIAALVPHRVRFDEQGLTLFVLLGERTFRLDEIGGASGSSLGHCLVHFGNRVYLLLPLLEGAGELHETVREVVEGGAAWRGDRVEPDQPPHRPR